MFDTALVLLLLAGLLIIVAVSQLLAARLKLPQSVLLAAIGICIGALPVIAGHFGLHGPVDVAVDLFAELPVNSAIFIYVFLPLLVFEAGVATEVKRTIQDAAPILILAVVATLSRPRQSVWHCGRLRKCRWSFACSWGSIVATTDPAAVIAVFRDLGAPRRLTLAGRGRGAVE